VKRLIPRSRGGSLWRFALASVLIIGFVAATTAVAGLLQVKNIVDALNLSPSLKNTGVELPAPGKPETLLLIGSDHRYGTPYTAANTDTMMLVRIDDSSQTINVLSIPRDLKVELPGGGIGKLNSAYALGGGPKALIKTLKTQVFPGLQVNHVIDVNFGGFEKLIDAIGCVNADADHRYYNVSQLGADNYSSIDVQPGYQKMCGAEALSFVRFRHTDSDIVRAARQQDFLRWAKDGYSAGQLVNDRDKLVKIFGKNSQSDHFLHTTDGILELFDLVVNAQKLAVKQVKFPYVYDNGSCGGFSATGTLLPATCADYVVPISSAAEHQAYRTFMAPTQPKAKPATTKHHKKAKLSTAGLIADAAGAHSQAAALTHPGFPVYVPKLRLSSAEYCLAITANCNDGAEPSTAYTDSYPRQYKINGKGGRYDAYRITVDVNSVEGQYYGIQGVNWLTPPILNNASGYRTINGKKLMLFYNGAHLSMVAWRTATSSYWISNSLTSTALDNAQMLEIAASLTRTH
jgi:LCP family protein required for cell wall assembly